MRRRVEHGKQNPVGEAERRFSFRLRKGPVEESTFAAR
jgi:hypothetical protein